MTNVRSAWSCAELRCVAYRRRSNLIHHAGAVKAKRASLMEDTQCDLIWRWEVKKVSSLGTSKTHGLALRAWFKQVHSDASQPVFWMVQR